MRFRIGCQLGYRVKGPTPFVFNIEAASFPTQTVVEESFAVEPKLEIERWLMPESGNRYLRCLVQEGPLTLTYRATVDLASRLEAAEDVVELAPGDLPLSVLPHLWPSRYCQADKLNRFAQRTFGSKPMGYRRVNDICNWIHDNVDYEGGVSDELTSAFDTVTERAGVCRDFSHLAIALCRAIGIPARYVSAYAYRLEPPDFHAVIEAFLLGPTGPGWYVFDPTRKSAADGLVRIGIGRDAAEVAFATPFGDIEFDKPKVWIETDQTAADSTTQAVRTSD